MNFLTNSLIKGALPLVKENLDGLDAFVLSSLQAAELTAQEKSAVYMLVKGTNGKCYVCLCTLDARDKIAGIKEKKLLKDFILELLQNIE